MCIHREHRTGNCRECHPFPPVADATQFRSTVQADGSVIYRVPPAMPLLWEGDNA